MAVCRFCDEDRENVEDRDIYICRKLIKANVPVCEWCYEECMEGIEEMVRDIQRMCGGE